MVDNYWDDSNHSLKTTLPNKGKNSPTPLQDVSSIVTGQVLWDINHNFCQSWIGKIINSGEKIPLILVLQGNDNRLRVTIISPIHH